LYDWVANDGQEDVNMEDLTEEEQIARAIAMSMQGVRI
jgi:hypothetical protein